MAHLHARCDRLGNHDVSKDEVAKALTNTVKYVMNVAQKSQGAVHVLWFQIAE